MVILGTWQPLPKAPGSPGSACHSWGNVLGNGLVVY